jgi:hypothetical protein
MEIKERYVDGIGKIHFCGGMIRFDMFSFEPVDGVDEDGNEKRPEPVLVERLVMSPNGFLSSYESMVNMINKLTEAGILAKREENNEEISLNAENPVVPETTAE